MGYDIRKPEDILKIKREDLNQSLFTYIFGNREKYGPRFQRNHKLVIGKDQYPYGNKEPIVTSIGNYMINYSLFNENVYNIIGYVNKRFSADVIGDIDKKLSAALLNDKISTKDIIDYLDRIQFYGFGLNSLVTPSLTELTMFALPNVMKRKDELEKQYKAELDAGDVVVADKIEKELMQLAKETIGKDKGMELYDSGSKASFSNNYKLMNIMKGALLDPETGKYKISTANYENGVPKEETHMFASSMVANEYAKGCLSSV